MNPRIQSRFAVLASPLVLAVSLLLAAVPAAAREPFSFDKAYGRLPKDVVPVEYEVSIVPDAAALTTRGRESVQLEFRSATARIQFNSFGQVLSGVTLDGKPVASVASDDEAQLTTVQLSASAASGPHVLRFSFTGKIDERPQGLFRQAYVTPAGAKGTLLTTQMESIYARRMFPCWDEPAFRARFALEVTAPAAWTAVANMPAVSRVVKAQLATTRFATTPKMPAYLVELTVGDIGAIHGMAGRTKVSVWAVRGQQQGGEYALGNAKQILADYNDYFGVPFPLPKLDSIAVPGGFSGAMENWGAITYNDQVLLVTAASTVGNRQDVYSVQAHEMAHQWFGDLVTMGWWDDIWLNESFASWMAAKQTDRRNPDWHWWLGEDNSKEDAMAADAIAGVHAIEQHVTNENEVDNAFDPQITYSKGQSILRMIESWLGPDVFRDGVRSYMKDRAYSNATSADLWKALGAASGRDVAATTAGWTEKPGFPLVLATASCDAAGARTLSLQQERFYADGQAGEASSWNVPLLVRAGATASAVPVLMGSPGQSVPAGRCDEPLSINADAIGYFRVGYDAGVLANNMRAFGALPAADRLALLDDQWALASAGRAPLAHYLGLVQAQSAASDLVPRAWLQVTDALEGIENSERGTPGYQAYVAYARGVLKPVLDRLGWVPKGDETPDLRRLRRTLFADLGQWGDAAVIAEARRRFAAFLADRKTLAPDEQSATLSIIARHADAATLEQLKSLAEGTQDTTEIRRFYGALTEVKDPQLAQHVLDIALSGKLPPQANSLPRNLVFGVARQNPALAWKAFSEHTDQVLASSPMFASMIIAQYSPQIFWSGVPLADIEKFARSKVPENLGPLVDRGMTSARVELKRKDTLVREADAFLKN